MYLPEKGCDFLIRIDGKMFREVDTGESIACEPVDEKTFFTMQYSGIEDSKEVSLYEGDIIMAKRFEEEKDLFKAVIVFNHGCFRETHFNDALCNLKCVNKIGNMYENSELLEGTDVQMQNL